VVWWKPSFRPTIHYKSPCVLSPKPWFRLPSTFNFLNFMHLQSPQCDETIDLMILKMLLNLMVQTYPFSQRLRSNSELWYSLYQINGPRPIVIRRSISLLFTSRLCDSRCQKLEHFLSLRCELSNSTVSDQWSTTVFQPTTVISFANSDFVTLCFSSCPIDSPY
jgi:hypothetical protein